jgi:hypothetical protein
VNAARALAIAAAVSLPAPLLAQGGIGGRVTALTGVEVRSLSFQSGLGIKSVSEIAVPFGVLWSATPRLSFDLGGRYASATRKDEGGGSNSISGLTDIQARGTYQLVRDVAVLTVAANLPTGTTALTDSQVPVAGVIASDLLPFPVANFGSGFNITSGVALAVPVAGWAVGVAGSYRANASFTPLADTTACPVSAGKAECDYKPGGEFRLRLGVDRIVGQSRIALGFTFSTFGDDAFGSSPIYQSGKRYITQGSWSFPVGNVGLVVYAWDLYRAAGSIPVSGASTDKRNVLTFGTMASLQMGRSILRPQIEYRRHSLGAGSLSNAGYLLSLGVRYQLPVGGRFTALPSLRFDTGNIVDQTGGQSVGYTGFHLGVTLRAEM